MLTVPGEAQIFKSNSIISTTDLFLTHSSVTTHKLMYCIVQCYQPKDCSLQKKCFAKSLINKQCIKHTTSLAQMIIKKLYI